MERDCCSAIEQIGSHPVVMLVVTTVDASCANNFRDKSPQLWHDGVQQYYHPKSDGKYAGAALPTAVYRKLYVRLLVEVLLKGEPL